jgi:glycosyltransferase involved in cell wall biosynthesis
MLSKAFPNAGLYTSLYDPEHSFPEFATLDIQTMAINRIGAFRRNHRLALPLLPRSFSGLRIDADVTLCSSSGFAHGTATTGRKVVYCYSPPRWLYHTEDYLGSGRYKAALGKRGNLYGRVNAHGLKALIPSLRRWDQRAARSADRYLTTSNAMAREIERTYGIAAEVVHPPGALAPLGPHREVTGVDPGFLLCVSRMMPYKNLDVVVKAMEYNRGDELVVVGDGPQFSEFKNPGSKRIHFLGRVEDDQLRWLYENSRALVSAAFEDYGLTPLEAAAFGKPVIVLRGGGFIDTVVEGTTGHFFDKPHPRQVADAIREADEHNWDSEKIVAHAATFSEEGFISRIREIVIEETNLRLEQVSS